MQVKLQKTKTKKVSAEFRFGRGIFVERRGSPSVTSLDVYVLIYFVETPSTLQPWRWAGKCRRKLLAPFPGPERSCATQVKSGY